MTIEHEATTEFRTHEMVQASGAMQAFLDDLTSEQRRRFGEFAHELYHSGFVEGLRRPMPELTEEQQASVLIRETNLFLQGAGALREVKED